MRKRLVVLVMLLAMLSNMFLSNNISVYAFELREGDISKMMKIMQI